MQDLTQGRNTSHAPAHRSARYAGSALTIIALSLAAAVGLSAMHRPKPASFVAPAPIWDASRFLLNALLAPALDADAVPLRWVDPRTSLQCGPASAVLVNHEPLHAGALVPDGPFELDWLTDDCRPFGTDGPRLDGRLRLTVYREDWGWSAMVEPSDLRITRGARQQTLARPCGASLPQDPTVDDPTILTELTDQEALPCR